MKAKRYSTEFKSSIVALYNEGRSVNRWPMNIIWLYKRLRAASKISNQSQLLLY